MVLKRQLWSFSHMGMYVIKGGVIMAKDPDGYEYEETPEYFAMMEILNQMNQCINESRNKAIDEINNNYGGIINEH